MSLNFHIKFCTVLILTLAVLMSSCSSPSTPEQHASEFIERSELAFEDRDIRSLRKLVSSSYMDGQNRAANDVLAIAAAYIRGTKSIYLFTDLESAVSEDDLINARVLVAFGSRPVKDRAALMQLNADIYWFDIVLADENGNWKLIEAQWTQAMVDDFFKSSATN